LLDAATRKVTFAVRNAHTTIAKSSSPWLIQLAAAQATRVPYDRDRGVPSDPQPALLSDERTQQHLARPEMARRESEMERMKTAHSDARPPRWAEAILRLLLKPEDENIVPALGSAADRWYVRQVASFLFRASWRWGAFLGAALIIRYLFDTLVPPADYLMRARILTYTVMAACALPGFYWAWRARSMPAGMLISISAATIGALLSIVGTGVMLTIWHDPVTLDAWRRSGGLDEALIDVPLKLVAIGATLGFAGALCGRSLSVALRTR
jgi:hypothetical protein